MASENSFDVVSEFDEQELVNALDQVRREIGTRFDLKDSGSTVDYDKAGKQVVITGPDEMKVSNIRQIIEDKLIKRGLSTFLLQEGKTEEALGGNVRMTMPIKSGIDKDMAKKIVADIKSTKLKVQASIQGDQVRVSGKNRDDLQTIIQRLKDQSNQWEHPLQFTNYR